MYSQNNKAVIEVEDVSIAYRVGDFRNIGLKETVLRKLRGNYHVREFRAVDKVSFEVKKGEVLGIVGTNGAGKSTLLKALTGIMLPTRGRVTVNGRIAALLELASGFDDDLTVKENTYLRGALMGYSRKFMIENYEDIISFAELQEFQDRLYRHLSSGMKSRLAFSIASLVEPDVLILDEVLAVGDGAFRQKSEQKIRDTIRRGAAAILVSHSIEQIREMCTRVLWMEAGKIIRLGETESICDEYEEFLARLV